MDVNNGVSVNGRSAAAISSLICSGTPGVPAWSVVVVTIWNSGWVVRETPRLNSDDTTTRIVTRRTTIIDTPNTRSALTTDVCFFMSHSTCAPGACGRRSLERGEQRLHDRSGLAFEQDFLRRSDHRGD